MSSQSRTIRSRTRSLPAWTGGASADPSRDESGRGRGKSESSRESKAEDRSGGKVERKRGKDGDDKDEVTCKGGRGSVVGARTAGYPGVGTGGTVGRPQVRPVGDSGWAGPGGGGYGSGRPGRR